LLVTFDRHERVLIDVDIRQAESTRAGFEAYIFTEDVKVENSSEQVHRICVHGPRAVEAVSAASQRSLDELQDHHSVCAQIAGAEMTIVRRDQLGEPGIEVFLSSRDAEVVWRAMLARQVQPIGWHAYNIARIEAGTPLFNIDFGATNLPHETGVLSDRVSFTKGCYPGQEVVARMQHLGKPRQMLVGLIMEADLLPVAGAQVFAIEPSGSMGEQVGVVTSSTLSPMLSAAPVAFAMIKTAWSNHGGRLLVNAEGQQTYATVGPLQFWSRTRDPAADGLTP
jgi:folate-binding protein YgfZ